MSSNHHQILVEAASTINSHKFSKYFLKTQRIGFRIWKEEDLDLAIGLWGDVKVTRFFNARGQLSSAQVTERLLQEIDTERLHGIQ